MATMSALDLALEHLRINDDIHRTSAAVNFLAAESRSSPDVRFRLAEKQILRNLVEIVKAGLPDSPDSTADALRCIGNACNDDGGGDAARDEMTTQGFKWASQCLNQGGEAVKRLTVKVLFNVCSGHEAAQKKCFADRVHYALLDFMADFLQEIDDEDDTQTTKELAVEILFAISGQKTAQASGEQMPEQALFALLSLPASDLSPDERPDMKYIEMLATLLQTMLVFVRDAAIQCQIIEARLVELLWRRLEQLELILEMDLVKLSTQHPSEDLESIRQLLVSLSTELTWVLSDIFANKAIVDRYVLEDELIAEVNSELTHCRLAWWTEYTEWAVAEHDSAELDGAERKAIAASQILGNFFWNLPPASYMDFVTKISGQSPSEHSLQVAALRILRTARTADLLHSMAGLVIQLARSGMRVRQLIGADENAEPALQRLCRHERLEIKQDAIRVLKALGNECPANQERFADLAREVMEAVSSQTRGNSALSLGGVEDGNPGLAAVTEEPSDEPPG